MEIKKQIFKNNKMEISLIYSHQETIENLEDNNLEIGYLLKGKAKIIFDDGEVLNLEKGSFFEIKPNRMHKVLNLSKKSLWLTVIYTNN